MHIILDGSDEGNSSVTLSDTDVVAPRTVSSPSSEPPDQNPAASVHPYHTISTAQSTSEILDIGNLSELECQFQPAWLKQYPWLHYSPHVDGAFCKSCAFFAPDKVGGNTPGAVCNHPFQVVGKNVRKIEKLYAT